MIFKKTKVSRIHEVFGTLVPFAIYNVVYVSGLTWNALFVNAVHPLILKYILWSNEIFYNIADKNNFLLTNFLDSMMHIISKTDTMVNWNTCTYLKHLHSHHVYCTR